MKLFSPQHWSTEMKRQRPHLKKPSSTTDADTTTLWWNNGEDVITIPHDPNTNVATFQLAPGYKDFKTFIMDSELMTDKAAAEQQELPMVTGDEYSFASDEGHPDEDTEDPWITDWHYDLTQEEHTDVPLTDPEGALDAEGAMPRLFDLTPDDQITSERVLTSDEEEEAKQSNPSLELLLTHHRHNHLSFAKIKAMAAANILPARLKKMHQLQPVQHACMARQPEDHGGTSPNPEIEIRSRELEGRVR